MNCINCGRFMKIAIDEDDSPLEDEVFRWWYCRKCGLHRPEHLYFKSAIRVNLSLPRSVIK